ncbi:hypothetical protein Tco_0253967, partial [Tanacetum coccineum]
DLTTSCGILLGRSDDVSLSVAGPLSCPQVSKQICPAWVMEEGCASGPETIVHSSRIILLLRRVSIPPGSGNFDIP